MRIAAPAVLILFLVSTPDAFAQNEAALKSFFEGRRVTVKLDMPATSTGIDVYPQRERPLDFKQYGDRIKAAGVAIGEGETVMVTLVKVKKDLIEFQLAGGGYDSGSGYVAPDYVGKSNLEKQLEKDVKAETDAARKRRLQQQLDDERNRREREQRRANESARREEAANRARIADERLRAGSRFNIRYQRTVPPDMGPQGVMEVLAEYIDFSPVTGAPAGPAAAAQPAVTHAGDGLPRKGMLRADAEREFGKPQETTERKEGALKVTTVVFVRGEQRIAAEFVEDVLIRYTISSR